MLWLLRSIAALLLVACLAIGGLAAWWLLGDKESWKPVIAESFAAQNVQVTIGDMSGGFSKNGPTLELHGVQLADAGQEPFLNVPHIRATLLPLAVVQRKPAIRALELDGATITQPLRLLALLGQQDSLKSFSATETALALPATVEGAQPQTIILHQLTAITKPRLRVVLTGAHGVAPLELDLQAGTLSELLDGSAQPLAANLEIDAHTLAISAIYSRRPLDGQTWNLLDKLALKLDGQQMTGAAAILTGDVRPRVAVTLNTPAWTLPAFASDKQSKPATPAPIFSRAALPWEALTLLDGGVTLAVDQIMQNAQPLGPAYLQAQVQDGVLSATALLQPTGNPQPLRLDLLAAAATKQVRLRAEAPHLDLASGFGLLGRASPLKAPLKFAADISSQGTSPHDLAAGAQGRADLDISGGRLDPAALPDVARRPLEFIFGPDKLAKASLSCLRASFAPGKAVPNFTLGLTSDLVDVAGTGEFDLNQEGMELALVAAPLIAPLTGVHVPLNVTGPMRDPSLGADTQAAINQLTTRVAAHVASTVVGIRLGKSMGEKAGALASSVVPKFTGDHGEAKLDVPMPPNACAAAMLPPQPDETAPPPAPDMATGPGRKGVFDIISPQMQTEIGDAQGRLAAPIVSMFGNLLKGLQ